MNIYQIKLNKNFGKEGIVVKPIHIYIVDGDYCRFYGRRNLAGLHELKGHEVEIDENSFSEHESLLVRIKNRLEKLNIEAKLI